MPACLAFAALAGRHQGPGSRCAVSAGVSDTPGQHTATGAQSGAGGLCEAGQLCVPVCLEAAPAKPARSAAAASTAAASSRWFQWVV
jgi:hypothetical protein